MCSLVCQKTYDLYSNILFFLTLRISMSLNRLYLLHHMLNLERLFYLALSPIGRSCQNFSSNIYNPTCILSLDISILPAFFAPNIKSLFFLTFKVINQLPFPLFCEQKLHFYKQITVRNMNYQRLLCPCNV